MLAANKFYVMTGGGRQWSDYDGPFDSAKDGVAHLVKLCSEWASPETINSAVLVYFNGKVIDLVKDDNGSPIDGKQISWRNPIFYKDELVWESENS